MENKISKYIVVKLEGVVRNGTRLAPDTRRSSSLYSAHAEVLRFF